MVTTLIGQPAMRAFCSEFWLTVREAIEGWGQTLRLVLILLALAVCTAVPGLILSWLQLIFR